MLLGGIGYDINIKHTRSLWKGCLYPGKIIINNIKVYSKNDRNQNQCLINKSIYKNIILTTYIHTVVVYLFCYTNSLNSLFHSPQQ